MLAPLPDGDLAVFIYHSFSEKLVRTMAERLVSIAPGRRIFLIYENPVHAAVLDALPPFERWQAATIPCGPDEVGFQPETEEVFVTWCLGQAVAPAHPGAEGCVGGTPWRAELT